MKGFTAKDIVKMNAAERKAKLQELRFELVRSRVRGKSSKIQTKEIKKAIARVLTITQAASKRPSVNA